MKFREPDYCEKCNATVLFTIASTDVSLKNYSDDEFDPEFRNLYYSYLMTFACRHCGTKLGVYYGYETIPVEAVVGSEKTFTYQDFYLDAIIQSPRVTSSSVELRSEQHLYVVTWESSLTIKKETYPILGRCKVWHNDITPYEE
jgi:hypothetical protein